MSLLEADRPVADCVRALVTPFHVPLTDLRNRRHDQMKVGLAHFTEEPSHSLGAVLVVVELALTRTLRA